MLFQVSLAYMTAVGGLHAHQDADFLKAMDKVNELRTNAFNSIPYYANIKGSEEDGVTADAKAMADRYRKVFGDKKDRKAKAAAEAQAMAEAKAKLEAEAKAQIEAISAAQQ